MVMDEDTVMGNRWADDEGGYPKAMLNVLHVTVNRCAVEWIDKNCPEAWYRDVFTGEEIFVDAVPINENIVISKDIGITKVLLMVQISGKDSARALNSIAGFSSRFLLL